MNKKGQALVEFVIVMPVLILILVAIIDYGNIYFTKLKIQNTLDDIVVLYENKEIDKMNYLAKQNGFILYHQDENKITTIVLSKDIKINAPFLNLVLGNTYKIEEKRIIYNE